MFRVKCGLVTRLRQPCTLKLELSFWEICCHLIGQSTHSDLTNVVFEGFDSFVLLHMIKLQVNLISAQCSLMNCVSRNIDFY